MNQNWNFQIRGNGGWGGREEVKQKKILHGRGTEIFSGAPKSPAECTNGLPPKLGENAFQQISHASVYMLTFQMPGYQEISLRAIFITKHYHPFFLFFAPGTVMLISTFFLLGVE